MQYKILIADDEPMLTELLADYLTDAGYLPYTASDSLQAMEKLAVSPDLILLDINMPGMNGLELCRTIREEVTCPILFLTARTPNRTGSTDCSLAGDDYITKPFSLPEVAARISAHLRREARSHDSSRLMTSRGLLVNLSRRTVYYKGDEIALSKREFDILELLLTHAGQVFDRERIYETVWGLDASGGQRCCKRTYPENPAETADQYRSGLYRNSLGDGISMETIKSGGLRRAFVLYVLITFLLVSALSGTFIWVCLSLQDHLLPDSDLVYLTVQRSDDQGNETTTTVPMPLNDVLKEIPSMISMEDTDGDILSDEQNVRYSVTKIENSFSALSPKRQLVYQISQIAMVALPVLFSLTGILICGFLFYHRKLKTPVELLSTAAERIAHQDLDFQISYPSEDEMGALCVSFEEMRQTLKDNSQKLWDMVEERRRLQSSVAHDLRNPIAIIQGYAQYLQLNLSGGRIHKEKISEVCRKHLPDLSAPGAIYRLSAHRQSSGGTRNASPARGFCITLI